MSNIKDLTDKILKFRDERNWKQFHNPKDLAISLSLEAAEVLEHFQWKGKPGEMEKYIADHKDDLGAEMADVLYCILLLANEINVDLVETFEKKMAKNALKYPIEKAKDSDRKYTDL